MIIPKHLQQDKIEKSQAPTTSEDKRLPFHLLPPEIFELFCCELVHRMIECENKGCVHMILPIGKIGQKQGGADIFAQKTSEYGIEYELYEVKRVERYTLSHYKDTVKRFLREYDSWGLKIESFYLLIAKEIAQEDIARWKKEAGILSKRKIKYEIIPASRINKWVQNFPGLVYRFFHPAWVEQIFGQEVLLHLRRYGEHTFADRDGWVGYAGVSEIEDHPGHFVHRNDDVCIDTYLPTIRRNSASCLIEFRNGRFRHVSITLNHLLIINILFKGVYTPLSSKQRPFLLNSFFEEEFYICDLGNCRIRISKNEATSLCMAIDAMWERYQKSVSSIENLWCSSGFPSRRGEKGGVYLMQIKRVLWAILLNFTTANSVFDTTGEWSIFDFRCLTICVLTINTNTRMDCGHHVFIQPETDYVPTRNYRYLDDLVSLCWEAPREQTLDDFGGKIGPRYYWDALYTHRWLIEKLIPAALDWHRRKASPWGAVSSLFTLKKNQSDTLHSTEDLVNSYFSTDLAHAFHFAETVSGLQKMIEHLQIFFSCRLSGISIDAQSLGEIYSVLGKVLAHTVYDDYPYLRRNLQGLPRFDRMEELRDFLSKKVNTQVKCCTNGALISGILVSIDVCIRDKKTTLNDTEAKYILEKLQPFVTLMNEQYLLKRQSERVVPG